MSSHNLYTDFIKSCGYEVYAPSPIKTWCFYTDGKRVAYAQWGDRMSVSSVHHADRTVGTGFQISDNITKESLDEALACVAPSWARREHALVKKYPNLENFLNGHWCKLEKVA